MEGTWPCGLTVAALSGETWAFGSGHIQHRIGVPNSSMGGNGREATSSGPVGTLGPLLPCWGRRAQAPLTFSGCHCGAAVSSRWLQSGRHRVAGVTVGAPALRGRLPGSGGPRAPARTERGEQGLHLRTQDAPAAGEAGHVAGPFLDGTLAAWLCAQNLELGGRGSRAGPAPGDTGGDGRTMVPLVSSTEAHTGG